MQGTELDQRWPVEMQAQRYPAGHTDDYRARMLVFRPAACMRQAGPIGIMAMGLLELTITVGYLAAMCIYGYLCYVQGVMDRDRDGRLPAVQKALRFGDRFIEPAAPARRRAAEARQLGR